MAFMTFCRNNKEDFISAYQQQIKQVKRTEIWHNFNKFIERLYFL